VDGLKIIFSEVSQVQKAKAPCFLSYGEYRPNTNIEILYKTCQSTKRSHIREEGYKKEIRKVNMVDALLIQA
jgi:hypothetical protein